MTDIDNGIEAVRRAREEISREHDNDPRRLVQHYMTLQERHKDRLRRSPANKPMQPPTLRDAADRQDFGMSLPIDKRIEDFTRRLRAATTCYTIGSVRYGYTLVSIAVPGERWEVEFEVTGQVEIEVFKSDGTIHGADALDRLFERFSDAT